VKRSRAAGLGEQAVRLLLLCCAAASVLVTVGIVLTLGVEALPFFRAVPLSEFLFDPEWTPLFADPHFGIGALLSGTLLTSAIAMAVAGPLGLLAAIYLSEFAPPRLRAWLKPVLELLAGVPTVVFGYFALLVVTPLLQGVVPGLSGFNALSPGIVMGIMILPMVCSLSEDALHAVPLSLRESAWALGAGQVRAVVEVVVPAARSGILAAVTLGVARAVGETMIVAIAAGQQPRLTLDPRVPVETMTAFIVQVSMGDIPAGTLAWQTLFAVATALFAMTFTLNLLGQRLAGAARRAG
jgi:phosphate transport system permease protein